LIEAQDLVKRFGRLVAVDHVSFHIGPGESVALWGQNGAGKTTVLRCLLGVMPFGGSASINGFDVRREGKAARRLVGFVPQDIRFHDNLSVRETLFLFSRIRRAASDEIPRLVGQMGLDAFVDKRVRTLSGGVRQRLALAVSLLARPPVLFLDEPTANLDARSRREYVSFLQEQKTQGKTILFCSHRLEEVDVLAERVIVLERGRLVADCAPGALPERLGAKASLHVYTESSFVERALEVLTAHGFDASCNGAGIKVQVRSNEKAGPLNVLARAGVPVSDFDYTSAVVDHEVIRDH